MLTITFISFKTSHTLEINGDTISRSKKFVIKQKWLVISEYCIKKTQDFICYINTTTLNETCFCLQIDCYNASLPVSHYTSKVGSKFDTVMAGPAATHGSI